MILWRQSTRSDKEWPSLKPAQVIHSKPFVIINLRILLERCKNPIIFRKIVVFQKHGEFLEILGKLGLHEKDALTTCDLYWETNSLHTNREREYSRIEGRDKHVLFHRK